MSAQEQSTFEDLFFELNQDEDFRHRYDRQKPYYDLLRDIIALRKSLGITQEELARRLGSHQSTISRIESGDYDIRLGTFVDIAQALGARLDIRLVRTYQDLLDGQWHKLFQATSTTERTATYTAAPTKSYKVETDPHK